MKKKIFLLLITIVCLLLLLAVQMPCKTVITTETLSSIRNNDENYPEGLNNTISKSLFDPMSYPVFADSVYIIQELYLIKQDKTTYFVPYIMANIEDVGTAGTSTWGFWLNTLMVEEDGTTVINANEKYNKSASTLIVEADPNTVISESSYDRTLDNVVSITLDKNKWAAMDEHAFQLGASTLDSSQSHNVDAIVSFRWESALSFRIGKAVPFVIEASSEYVSNYNGIEEKVTLEQALQEYARQIVPGDGFYFGWKQLAEEESGEKGTAYGVLLFRSSSGSPLIYSEKLERYCSAIYSTYLLPISVSYENDTNGNCVITDCWMPSEENYEQDILDRFPPEAADLVLEELDQYATEIIEEIAEHDAEKVQAFFPGGPIWPAYSFDEALDNTSLCGLAEYYPVGDIYYEPVWNEVLRRFQNDSVALLRGLNLCNEEVQSTVRSFIAAEVGASKLEASLLALESNHEDQAYAEQINTEVAKPAAPPTDEDIRVALAANHAAVEASHMIVPDVSTPFRTEGWLVLAEESTATTHTFYLLTRHAIYDLLGSGTQTKYEDVAFCTHAAALTFLWQDNRWQLSEYWLPGDGAYYEADTRATFPAEAVDKLFGDNASLYDNDVIRQCDDAAVRYYAQLTNWVPTKTFYPSDVEFSGQTLHASTDTMTYEERLAWAQAGEDNGQIWPACTGQYREGEGCIAYVEKIVAGRYPDLSLRLRFADGTTSESLPLPRAGGYDTALPESMGFRNEKFIYEITFPTEELTSEGQTLIHLKGTYHYEVDLAAKTVSLTVLQ